MSDSEVKTNPTGKPAEKEATEKREKTPGEQKTAAFKAHLQAMLQARLGTKVSKEMAWTIYKDLAFGTLQFVVSQEDKRLPLSGLGTYEIIKAGARGKKREDGKLYTPKYRFYPSTTVDAMVTGFMGEGDIPEGVKFLGLYDKEDALDQFVGQAVANAEWLAATEDDPSEDAGEDAPEQEG